VTVSLNSNRNSNRNSSRKNSRDYRVLFLSDSPMIDLRAPCEFQLGAFPTAVNLPLMNDQEREQVGICYKRKGQQSAIELGHQLVCDNVKEERVETWKQFANRHLENGYFYCFRGGLRSRTSQKWLKEAGVEYPIIEGGYKAMRRFLIDETEKIIANSSLQIITGLTGCAKTKLIVCQEKAIDLEGLANHRGSSFGRRLSPQPTQINFENRLAIQLLKHHQKEHSVLILEDESRLIGARSIPLKMKNKMNAAPLVLIEENFDYRVAQIYDDYVILMNKEYQQIDADNGLDLYHQFLLDSTEKIKKRLGGIGLKEMRALINKAILQQRQNDDASAHKDWIVYLLKNYYDPMYLFQMDKKKDRISFKGNTASVRQYLETL